MHGEALPDMTHWESASVLDRGVQRREGGTHRGREGRMPCVGVRLAASDRGTGGAFREMLLTGALDKEKGPVLHSVCAHTRVHVCTSVCKSVRSLAGSSLVRRGQEPVSWRAGKRRKRRTTSRPASLSVLRVRFWPTRDSPFQSPH